jgi:hypothetical protein
MDEYDLYISRKTPSIGLYVPKGATLPDFAEKDNWIFDGTAAEDLLPSTVIKDVKTNGHAFRKMD